MEDIGFDPAWFRHVLGKFPTGVAIVTGRGPGGAPAGLAIGSFTSASLDPPLVAFFPSRRSSSWPQIRASGSFCVNILGADQEALSHAFAAPGAKKFAGVGWWPAPSGSPVLEGAIAWIDCDIEAVHEAGDHWVVLGRTRALDVTRPAPPLVFFQGGYGQFTPFTPFTPPSLTAAEADLAAQVKGAADLACDEMDSLAGELGAGGSRRSAC